MSRNGTMRDTSMNERSASGIVTPIAPGPALAAAPAGASKREEG
jgi:hypothetical protein